METIFDFSVTEEELTKIGIDAINLSIRHGADLIDPITKENYTVSQSDAWFDLALLFEYRSDPKTANCYWLKVQARHREYILGFDDTAIIN